MTAPALPRIATFKPTILWGTGTPIDTSAYDDVSGAYLNEAGLQIDGIGRDQARAYSPPSSPAFSLTLTNHDGTYSPGGPLANFLGRGPAVTLDATWGVELGLNTDEIGLNNDYYPLNNPGTTRLFTGYSRSMAQQISRPQRTVQVSALGVSSVLLVAKKPTTILYESIRTDQAIAAILDAVGWDADLRSLDTGDTTLLYWWLNGQTTAISAINAILAAEGAGACAYEDGSGVFHFEGRQFRDNNPRSTSIQWSFFDQKRRTWDGLNTDQISLNDPVVSLNGGDDLTLYHVIPAEYQSNPDEVVGTVTATANVRTATPSSGVGKIWEYGGPLVLTAGQVLDIPVTSNDPFKGATTPVAATDYTVSAGSLLGVSLLTTSGQTAISRWTAGGSGATVLGVTSNGPQVRAVSLPVTTANAIVSTVDTDSAAARTQPLEPYTLSAWPEVSANTLLDVVNSMALRYQRERHQITIRIVNIDEEHMRAILNVRVSDRILFFHEHAALNETYWVEQIHYDISPGGGFITMTLGCERVFDLDAGKFDDARFDFSVFGA